MKETFYTLISVKPNPGGFWNEDFHPVISGPLTKKQIWKLIDFARKLEKDME